MTATRANAAIVGSGNIGTDLLYKLQRSETLSPRWMVGIDPASDGLRRARDIGAECVLDGVAALLAGPERPEVIFEATSAYVHRDHAPLYAAAGIPVVDLTPAAIGPFVIPAVNLHAHEDALNVNLITCGGQATIPIVHSVSRVVDVEYAEIVSTVASVSAGPGTRANIDEFTRTTARGMEVIGGARRGKAIIVLNPADPPILMRNTVICSLPDGSDHDKVTQSIESMVADVNAYVPGYRMRGEPQFDEPTAYTGGLARVTVFLEVEGAADYLPSFAGNLDIMTSAAVRVGEGFVAARRRAAATKES
ncbi:MAG TPA: acetaldehyde dehydrogenase (acetylating) [Ilumatobacteraceae bacterium]